MELKSNWRQRLEHLKMDTYALYLAYRDPRISWPARLWVVCVVAYALSPIDLIPDFIPVLGYLDDLILIPLGIVVAVKLVPPEVMADCRERARLQMSQDEPGTARSRIGFALVVIAIWAFLAILTVSMVARFI